MSGFRPPIHVVARTQLLMESNAVALAHGRLINQGGEIKFIEQMVFSMRLILAFCIGSIGCLCGCAPNLLAPEEIAKLKGGTTTVVVYGFCVPINHLVKTTLTRSTLNIIVDGKAVGTIETCSHATFSVPSGYWETSFQPQGLMGWPSAIGRQAYRPGVTQYLSMQPAGNYSFSGHWVTKAEADRGIAEIRKIGQML